MQRACRGSRLSLRCARPPARARPGGGVAGEHVRRFGLLAPWPGILLAAVAVSRLPWRACPCPGPRRPRRDRLFLFGLVAVLRLGRYLVRRLLWRIRTKLIVSYLFIAFVPVVLLTLFFLLAGRARHRASWPPTWSARTSQSDAEALRTLAPSPRWPACPGSPRAASA